MLSSWINLVFDEYLVEDGKLQLTVNEEFFKPLVQISSNWIANPQTLKLIQIASRFLFYFDDWISKTNYPEVKFNNLKIEFTAKCNHFSANFQWEIQKNLNLVSRNFNFYGNINCF